jgi:hypothetical protein
VIVPPGGHALDITGLDGVDDLVVRSLMLLRALLQRAIGHGRLKLIAQAAYEMHEHVSHRGEAPYFPSLHEGPLE